MEDLDLSEYCPVAIGAKLVADRWTVMIIRELMLGSNRFNDIHRGLPGCSRSLLSARLRHLEQIGVVDHGGHRGAEYQLTMAGRDLTEFVVALGSWTSRWRFPEPTDGSDNAMLLWRMRSGLIPGNLPKRRVVVEFVFTDGSPRNGWLILENQAGCVSLQHPGLDVDVYLTAPGGLLYAIWFGHRDLAATITAGDVVLDGDPLLGADFVSWFALSRFAPQVAARRSEYRSQ